MIIVKLMGGLGNQMFQYAAGRRLAYFNNTILKIDLNWFKNISKFNTPRKFGLDKFNIQENFATEEEVKVLTVRENRLGRLLSGNRERGRRISYILEKHFHFDPDILNLPDNIYLDGHWQSEKYFADIKNIIYKEFTIKTKPEGKNLELSNQIAELDSVSLHVRCGDYLSNQEIRDIHSVCNLDYYLAAVKHVVKEVKNPHIFIFTDDPEWVRNNIDLPCQVTSISNNGPERDYEDLRLMSLCKYHIIANSSFSWWGAWLSQNPGKIIIAPKHWFAQNKNKTDDIIPDSWVKL